MSRRDAAYWERRRAREAEEARQAKEAEAVREFLEDEAAWEDSGEDEKGGYGGY